MCGGIDLLEENLNVKRKGSAEKAELSPESRRKSPWRLM
jgi:hypothetical protein